MDFALWLKTERAKRRQTQAQLAAAMGYTQAAISKAEDGRNVAREFCHAVAMAWGIDEAIVLAAAGFAQSSGDEADELAEMIRGLGDDDRAVVRAVVVALRDRRKKSPAG